MRISDWSSDVCSSDLVVAVAVNGKYAGYLEIADEIKEDSQAAIDLLHSYHIRTVMLSGDKQSVVDKIDRQLRIDEAYGGLLPADKVQKVEENGRAKCRERVCKYVKILGDGVAI